MMIMLGLGIGDRVETRNETWNDVGAKAIYDKAGAYSSICMYFNIRQR